MPRISQEDLLRANADPTFGRRLLDAMEAGVWPARPGRRRIVARFGTSASAASGKPPDLPPPEFATVGQDKVRTVYYPPPVPVGSRSGNMGALRRRVENGGTNDDEFDHFRSRRAGVHGRDWTVARRSGAGC